MSLGLGIGLDVARSEDADDTCACDVPGVDDPVVSSVLPTGGFLGSATSIVITGTGFNEGCTLTVGGVACTSVVRNGSARVACVTPVGVSAGLKDLVLTNPGPHSGTLTNAFEYADPAADNPSTIAGANLQRWYGENYNGFTGVYVDESGHANTSQTTEALRPVQTTMRGHVSAQEYANHGLNCGGAVNPITSVGTVFALMRLDSLSDYASTRILIGKYYNQVTWGLGTKAGQQGKICFFTNDVASGSALSDARWDNDIPVRAIATYDKNASPSTKLYINGVLQATTATDAAGVTSTDFLSLGAGMGTSDSEMVAPFPGTYNNVGVIARVLSGADIARLDAWLLARSLL